MIFDFLRTSNRFACCRNPTTRSEYAIVGNWALDVFDVAGVLRPAVAEEHGKGVIGAAGLSAGGGGGGGNTGGWRLDLETFGSDEDSFRSVA